MDESSFNYAQEESPISPKKTANDLSRGFSDLVDLPRAGIVVRELDNSAEQLWQLTEQNSELTTGKYASKDPHASLIDYSSAALEHNIEDVMSRLNTMKSDLREDNKIDSATMLEVHKERKRRLLAVQEKELPEI